MPKTLTMEISEELYESILDVVERQESNLAYVVNEAFEIYILAEDYIEDDHINGESKKWIRLWKGASGND